MDDPLCELSERVQGARASLARVAEQVGRVVVGQPALIRRLLTGILCDGHVLVEGAPGLAKTLAVQCFAESLGLSFRRIQFTPDLLPADLVGTLVLDPRTQQFEPRLGPLFTSVVLADEINRAPPKVQSALLEAMQERQITFGDATHVLPDPFLVLATQNPLEHEGTYPLPEAELDRFLMKVEVVPPAPDDEVEILARHGHTRAREALAAVWDAEGILEARSVLDEVYADPKILDYVVRLVGATRDPSAAGCRDLELRHGASPRGSRALLLAAKGEALLSGRAYVTPIDVKRVAADVLAHRLGLGWELQASGRGAREVVATLCASVEVP